MAWSESKNRDFPSSFLIMANTSRKSEKETIKSNRCDKFEVFYFLLKNKNKIQQEVPSRFI